MKITESVLSETVRGYIESVYFADANEDQGNSSSAILHESAIETIKSDCADFLEILNREGLLDEWVAAGMTFESLGIDFWLTRNGHGAGFWDRGLGSLGDRITVLVKPYGEQWTDWDKSTDTLYLV